MSSASPIVIACCLALVGPATLGQTPRDQPAPPNRSGATVAGHVVTGPPGQTQPVRRARVTLEPAGPERQQVTDADADGAFHFSNVAEGAYRLRADRPGFVWIGARGVFDPPPTFKVEAGQTITSDIVLAPGAALEGTVIAERGEPAVNIVVSATRLTYGPYGRQPAAVREARTDDLGRYRIHSLPPGDYFVEATPDPLAAAARPASPPEERRPGMARTYYRGTPRVQEAEPVTLLIGQEIANLDFTMTNVALASVGGRVLDSSGRAPAGASVRLQGVGAPPGEVRGTMLPSDNRFQFPNVPPGPYWLMASARPSPDTPLEFAAMRIDIAGQDARDLVLTTARGTDVRGRIEVAGAPLPAGVQVVADETAFELPAPQPGGAPPQATSTSVVGPDGTFAFSSLFGPRVLRLEHLPAGWVLEHVWLDDAEVTDTATDFRTADVPRRVRVVLAPRGAVVSGLVTTAGGQPQARARVLVFARDPKLWGVRSRFVKSVEASLDGRYTVDGLLPGRYAIAAVAYLEAGAWDDPVVLTRLSSASETIVVAGQERLSVHLTSRSLLAER